MPEPDENIKEIERLEALECKTEEELFWKQYPDEDNSWHIYTTGLGKNDWTSSIERKLDKKGNSHGTS